MYPPKYTGIKSTPRIAEKIPEKPPTPPPHFERRWDRENARLRFFNTKTNKWV
jgi:hypothetical protein